MKRRILAVGMLPPPYTGQALMFSWAIEAIRSRYTVETIDIQAQRLAGTSGQFSFQKIGLLFRFTFLCLCSVLSPKPLDVLYYCPSGPSKIGLLKDLLLLTILRWRVRRTVYHFHGTGGVAYLLTMPRAIQWYARRVYFRPDVAIRCAQVEPNDAALCHARREVIINNGIPDPGRLSCENADLPVRLCFIGTVTEEKGVFDLVEIAKRIRTRRKDFVIDIIGEGTVDEVCRLDALITKGGVQSNIVRHGLLLGEEKFAQLAKAKLFLFPTFFRAETQPLVVIEAAALGIPSVVSDWRGLNSIVLPGVTGTLVPPRRPDLFADAVLALLESDHLEKMRLACRERYLEYFTRARFENNLLKVFDDVLD